MEQQVEELYTRLNSIEEEIDYHMKLISKFPKDWTLYEELEELQKEKIMINDLIENAKFGLNI